MLYMCSISVSCACSMEVGFEHKGKELEYLIHRNLNYEACIGSEPQLTAIVALYVSSMYRCFILRVDSSQERHIIPCTLTCLS